MHANKVSGLSLPVFNNNQGYLHVTRGVLIMLTCMCMDIQDFSLEGKGIACTCMTFDLCTNLAHACVHVY